MKKTARVIITSKCDRKCPGCCNSKLDYTSLAKVIGGITALKDYEEVVITGGEPMINPAQLYTVIKMLRKQNKRQKIYLYTACLTMDDHPVILKHLDGITVLGGTPTEKAIRRATYKMGTFGCYEVTIGYGGKERVDYMTYDTKGIFRCYEVKVSKADFHSAAVKSFVGHYNYYVLTRELYDQVKGEIPDWVGVYIGDYCAKRAKKQDLSDREYKTRRSINGRSTEVSTPWVEMLKESMIRSLYRDSDKLIQTEDEQYISRLRSQIDKARTERDRESKKYLRLWKAVRKEFGDEKAWELIEKAEE